MKKRVILLMRGLLMCGLLMCGLLMCGYGFAQAQAVKEYDFHLDNGAEVLYQTFSEANPKDPAPNLGNAYREGDAIVRTVSAQNVRTLGFRLRIEKVPGDPVRFRVSMGGLDLWTYFSQSAASREIQNGDRILLDVLEDPASGRKIYDSFQVGIGVGLHSMPVAKTIPRTPVASAVIHLQTPQLFQGQTELADNASVINGSAVSVHIAGKSGFTFSTQPQDGFRMEAIAEGNTLMFVSGSERYDIQCTAPVIDGAGAWYLWVRRDAAGGSSGFPALNLVAPEKTP